MPSPTALQQLSYYACSIDFDRIEADDVHHAVRVLADSLACALAATNNDEIKRIRQFAQRHADSDRSAILFGTSDTCAPAYAALVNSAMIRCLDANDLYIPRPPQSVLSAGHCSDALGGVLALVDPMKNTGRQLLTAVIVAYEVQVALASCMAWLERGLHSVSQINFAVPAAAAALPQYQLTPSQVCNAMALSATTGLCAQTWLKQNVSKSASAAGGPSTSSAAAAPPSKSAHSGAVPSVKFLSVGLASQRGVDSLSLGQLGLTGNSDALETMVRFFAPPQQTLNMEPFNQIGREGQSTMHRHLIKQYPAQFNLQAVITCALDLYRQGVRADQIAELSVSGHRFLCGDVQGSAEAFAPQSQGSADHSTPYVIWVALARGSFTPATAYGDASWLKPEVRAVLSKMTLHCVDEFERPRVERGQLGCRLNARTIDGRSFVAERLSTAGHPDLPLTDEELRDKINQLVDPTFGPGMGDKIWHACQALAHSEDTEATQEIFKLIATEPTR